ncbi:aspartyl-phosphate phosphatase Spo0E family protein [Peptococcaceae bacterium 1198_IL3148]
MKDFAQLLIKIEKMRSEMHQLANEKGIAHKDVVEVSQLLDNLLNEYYKIKRQGAASLKHDTKVLCAFKPKKLTLHLVLPILTIFFMKK